MTLETIKTTFSTWFTDFDILTFLKFTLIVSIACFLLRLLFRLVCGKKSGMRKSLDSAIAILIVYAASFALTFTESKYQTFLSPLPFVSIDQNAVQIFVLTGADSHTICVELVNTLVLAFCIGLLNDLIPTGRNFFTWAFFRCLSIILGALAHWGANWLFTTYLPDFIVTNAPVVLLSLVIILLAVSIFKVIIGTLLGFTVSPLVGAIYTFLISNIVGKQISRAAVTTLILTAAVYALNYFGIVTIAFGSLFISAFLPALLVLLILWYLLNKFL